MTVKRLLVILVGLWLLWQVLNGILDLVSWMHLITK